MAGEKNKIIDNKINCIHNPIDESVRLEYKDETLSFSKTPASIIKYFYELSLADKNQYKAYDSLKETGIPVNYDTLNKKITAINKRVEKTFKPIQKIIIKKEGEGGQKKNFYRWEIKA